MGDSQQLETLPGDARRLLDAICKFGGSTRDVVKIAVLARMKVWRTQQLLNDDNFLDVLTAELCDRTKKAK